MSLLLLSILIRHTPLAAMLIQLQQIKLSWFFLAIVFLQAVSILQAIRWRTMIIIPQENKPQIRSFYYHVAIGNFFNLCLMSGIGGDAVKSYALGKKIENVSRSVAALLLSRALGAGALIALFWLFFLTNSSISAPAPILSFMTTLTLGALLFVSWLIHPRQPTEGVQNQAGGHIWVQRLRYTGKALAAYQGNPLLLARGLVLSCLLQLLLLSCEYMAYRAVGTSLPYSSIFLFMPAIHIITLLPISLYGIGVREWLSIHLFTLLPGIENEHCLTAVFICYILSFLQAFIGGVLLLGNSLRHQNK